MAHKKGSVRWRWIGVVVLCAVLLTGVFLTLNLPRGKQELERMARERVIAHLREKYRAEVEIGKLEFTFGKVVEARAEDVILRRGTRDLPPFVAMKSFHAKAGAWVLRDWQVEHVAIEGLQITIPPKGQRAPMVSKQEKRGKNGAERTTFEIKHLTADGAKLTILSAKPGKDPLEWDIKKLSMTSVGPGKPMRFDTVLTNALPPGEVISDGSFGPWNAEDAGGTPVSGKYRFENADLGVFTGISGTLSSTGTYEGTLERMDCKGEARVPNFQLSSGAKAVELTTKFEAIVDGTNGETLLQPVQARFLNTAFTARGGVVNKDGVKGKWVILDVDMARGKLEDLLTLAVKQSPAALSGAIGFRAKLTIPPGQQAMVRKIDLRGKFRADGVRFSDAGTQERIAKLSRTALGNRKQPLEDVESKLTGDFALHGGVMDFKQVSFAVPGADIEMAGNYGLESQELAFDGAFLADAKLSQMTGGWKSWMLKPVDPFFRKQGRTRIPITVEGTREKPKFGMRLRSAKKKEER